MRKPGDLSTVLTPGFPAIRFSCDLCGGALPGSCSTAFPRRRGRDRAVPAGLDSFFAGRHRHLRGGLMNVVAARLESAEF